MLKLLPIGTIVRVKGARVPFMIAGYFPEDQSVSGYYYDYSAFPYPIGFSSTLEATFMNQTEIEVIIAMTYQVEQQMEYVKKLESFQTEAEGGEKNG